MQLYQVQPITATQRQARLDAYKAAERALEKERPRIAAATDEILEFAIAYWIEAKNARDSRDDERCLEALAKCSGHVGAAQLSAAQSHAKSEAGARQGQTLRDAVVDQATRVLKNLEPTSYIDETDKLWWEVIARMRQERDIAEMLDAYDTYATKGRAPIHDRDIRLTDLLIKWTKGRRPRCPELAEAFQHVLSAAKSLADNHSGRTKSRR